MTFPELVAAVIIKTNRPDKVDATELAVKEATHWAHTFDFFRRDLVETPKNYVPAAFKGTLNVAAQLPGLRKIAYWRKYEPLTGVVGKYLKQAEPDLLIDARFGINKTDVYYRGGAVFNWLSSTSDSGHMIGYWKLPILVPSGYNSWIAELYPFAIICRAASNIFRDIGQPEAMKGNRDDAERFIFQLQQDEVESAGR